MWVFPNNVPEVIRRIHENLENFEKKSAVVPDNVSLLFGTRSHSAQCCCES